jgi:quinol monooxygenase YgiN
MRAVDSFVNSKNDTLVQRLLNEAYSEDEEGTIAYYLVKDPDKHILFYFSLKCGQLYDKHLDFKLYKQLGELYDGLLKMKKEQDTSKEDSKIIELILEMIRSRKGVIKADLKRISKKNKSIEEFEKLFDDDTEKVGTTFSGIEIVQFCANENCLKYWEQYKFNQKLGVVIFWHFVVPIIKKLMDIVGCQYLFLFAADDSEDEDLVNYYKTWLKFESSPERSAATPVYDLTCKFLFQATSSLAEKQQYFYNNFNLEEDAV